MSISSLEVVPLIVVCILPAAFLLFEAFLWIFLGVVSLSIVSGKEYSKPSRFYRFVFYLGYRNICWLGRLKIHYKNLDKIPQDKSFMLISNHRSKFDNMIQALAIRNIPLAFISKEENFRIPIGHKYMTRNLYLSLKRGHPKEGLKTILKACQLVGDGITSVGVFPEGKRSKDCTLLPFMPGCFKIAEKTKCPIVVGITYGTEKVHENWPFRKTDVYFEVVKVLEKDDIKDLKTVDISQKTYEIIKESLDDLCTD